MADPSSSMALIDCIAGSLQISDVARWINLQFLLWQKQVAIMNWTLCGSRSSASYLQAMQRTSRFRSPVYLWYATFRYPLANHLELGTELSRMRGNWMYSLPYATPRSQWKNSNMRPDWFHSYARILSSPTARLSDPPLSCTTWSLLPGKHSLKSWHWPCFHWVPTSLHYAQRFSVLSMSIWRVAQKSSRKLFLFSATVLVKIDIVIFKSINVSCHSPSPSLGSCKRRHSLLLFGQPAKSSKS